MNRMGVQLHVVVATQADAASSTKHASIVMGQYNRAILFSASLLWYFLVHNCAHVRDFGFKNYFLMFCR